MRTFRPDDPDIHLEGGDVLRFADVLLCGTGPRTSPEAAKYLSEVLDVPVVPVPLTDPRFHHLDMSFCPLGAGRAIYVLCGLFLPCLVGAGGRRPVVRRRRAGRSAAASRW